MVGRGVVRFAAFTFAVKEASERGGEGGVAVTAEEVSDLSGGGVEAVGEESVVAEVEASETGERGRRTPCDLIARTLLSRCRATVASAWRSLPCTISASILRSESSSRRRWVSIRSDSRSCSLAFISSSSITPRSIATLYFDSRSSREEVVLRAWRSKSSFATSMSRSLSWSVRFESRRIVISFCNVFCAEAASALDCLYFACNEYQHLAC